MMGIQHGRNVAADYEIGLTLLLLLLFSLFEPLVISMMTHYCATASADLQKVSRQNNPYA
jgi:hypothetical protein